MNDRRCSIIGCDTRHYAKGYCKHHYRLQHDHGDALYVPVQRTPIERFHEKYIVLDSGCWQWIAGTRAGYGEFSIGKRKFRAHRFSYESFRSPIPEGWVIDHLCRFPLCVNPGHLEPVPFAENVLRGVGPSARALRRSACQNGHAYTVENTRINARGHRECRACDRESYHRRKRNTRPKDGRP